MKIGFFYYGYYPLINYGSSTHGYHLFKALIKKGHTILSCLGENNPGCVSYPHTIPGAIRLVKDADVLYIREDMSYYSQRIALLKLIRLFSVPVVWEINAPSQEKYIMLPYGLKKQFFTIMDETRRILFAKFVDAAICNSEPVKRYAEEVLRIKRAFVIPNGADPELFDPERKASPTILDDYSNYFKVGWIGLPWEITGINTMLEVADECYRLDKKILFVFIIKEIKTGYLRTPAIPIRNNILVLKNIEHLQVRDYLKGLDLCLAIYKNCDWFKYGFYLSPIKLFEYMAMAKPIIATGLGQISEAIQDGINGLLTNNSVEDIVDKILLLKNDKNLRENIGRKARYGVLKYYNWDRAAADMENVFRSLVLKC